MQLVLLALAIGVYLHDGVVGRDAAALWPAWAIVSAVFAPKLAVAAAYAAACWVVSRRLARPGGVRLLRWLDRLTGVYAYAALASYAADLYVGWLAHLRASVGDFVLVDELGAITPTLALLVWSWACYYPIDRRLREASLMARLDAGEPVYPIWTRGQYLLAQLRHQVALLLLPLLLIMGWVEAVEVYGPASLSRWPLDPRPALVLAGTLGVFLFTPVMLRHVWDTRPLPAGELRTRLQELAAREGVRVRELLLWRTYGGLINAAVMGLVAPVRYILLSDALLDMLDRRQVEAVMAHEMAHVRKRHMVWLIASAVASLGAIELVVGLVLRWAGPGEAAPEAGVWGWLVGPVATEALGLGVAVLGWVLVFGWLSRRFERQADAFAVQTLSAERAEAEAAGAGAVLIDGASVGAMVDALGRVARLNHIPPGRRSWRHGSIRWRQAYLRSLVGQPVGSVSIDRQMRWIQLATLAGIGLLVASAWWGGEGSLLLGL